MLLRGPHADRVVTQVVGEHGDRALEIVVRVVSERRETRELVEHERLPPILLGALEFTGREVRRRDLRRRLRERVDLRLPVALLRRAMLHVHDAKGAAVGPERRDHRFARGRVGATLHVAREEHRPPGLRDRPGDAFTDPFAIQLRRIREAARGTHRQLALRVREHYRDAIRAEHVGELRRGALEKLFGVALLADDRLEVARRLELRLGVLPLPLRAPERVRLRELEADEVPNPSQRGQILRREGTTDEHRGQTPDDLVFPHHRSHAERVSGAAVREHEPHVARRLGGGTVGHRLREHRGRQTLGPLGLVRKVMGDVRRVALAFQIQDHGDRVGARDLREIRHARVPEVSVEPEGQGEALRHAGAGLALDAELQGSAAAALQCEARLF